MAEIGLGEAYGIAFGTPAGIQVLRHLAAETGFFAALPAGTDQQVLADHNAARRVFGAIYEILASSPEGREALAVALSPASTKE